MTETTIGLIDGDAEGWAQHLSPTHLQMLYHRDGGPGRRIATRRGLWAAVLVYLLFSLTDIILIPDVAHLTVAARFLVGLGTLVAVEWQFRTGASADRMDVTCAIALVLAYGGWLFTAINTHYTETISYYLVFGAIFMMSANLFFSFRFLFSVSVSGIMLLASIAVLFHALPGNRTYQLSFGLFYVSCFIFTSYVNWRLNKERYNVFLNAVEAKRQHKEATERGMALLRLSRTDPLTGLDNRRAVDERLRDLWHDWQKHGRTFGVMLIDVDFFKRFNDCYGHQEGDSCLVFVAEALRRTFDATDVTIGRYGGEEFIALAPLSGEDELKALAEDIRGVVEDLNIRHEQRLDGFRTVTVSVGATFTRHLGGGKLEKIIHEADRALYLAKASGRNCAKLFDPGDPQSNDESENIAGLLGTAIEKNLVSLVYQPIQDVATRRTCGLEALMRLNMPDGISVPPSLFIPLAERNGTIVDLGRWAIRTACLEILANDLAPVVSVNVSPIQLKAPGFAASVAAILGETGVSGSRLAFEITEGLDMEMHADVLRCVGDLKLLGIEIWLDDFGTGFAGLSWLRLIDFDTVKIDRSFLHDSVTPRGEAMLRDIIGLIRNRGPRILIEGVESEDQMTLTRRFGIDRAQGYYVGRPTGAESFRHFRSIQQRRASGRY